MFAVCCFEVWEVVVGVRREYCVQRRAVLMFFFFFFIFYNFLLFSLNL